MTGHVVSPLCPSPRHITLRKRGNLRYQACVENNLAFPLWKSRRVAEAHQHADRAQILFAIQRQSS